VVTHALGPNYLDKGRNSKKRIFNKERFLEMIHAAREHTQDSEFRPREVNIPHILPDTSLMDLERFRQQSEKNKQKCKAFTLLIWCCMGRHAERISCNLSMENRSKRDREAALARQFKSKAGLVGDIRWHLHVSRVVYAALKSLTDNVILAIRDVKLTELYSLSISEAEKLGVEISRL
jgi:hypothetical protein